jgi:hypothetical protein
MWHAQHAARRRQVGPDAGVRGLGLGLGVGLGLGLGLGRGGGR